MFDGIIIYTVKELCEYIFESYSEEEYDELVESKFMGWIYSNDKNMCSIELSMDPDSVIQEICDYFGDKADVEKIAEFFMKDNTYPDPNCCWFRIGWYDVWYSAGVCKKLCGEWQ